MRSDLDALGNLCRDQMPVLFSRVIASEHNFQARDLYQEHGGTQDMAGRIWGDTDGGDGVGRVVVDSLNLREGVEVVLFRVDGLRGRIRGGIPNPDAILDKPLIYSLGWMGHEHPASEIRLGQDVWKRGCMVYVETLYGNVSERSNQLGNIRRRESQGEISRGSRGLPGA